MNNPLPRGIRLASLLVIGLLSVLISDLNAQSYYVAIVKGQVYYQNQPLQRRDKITLGGQLRFSSPQDYVKVSGPGGLHTLRPPGQSAGSGNEFLLALRQEIFPTVRYSTTASPYIPPTDPTRPYFLLEGRGFATFAGTNFALPEADLAQQKRLGFLHETPKGLRFQALPADATGFILDPAYMNVYDKKGRSLPILRSVLIGIQDMTAWSAYWPTLKRLDQLSNTVVPTRSIGQTAPTVAIATEYDRLGAIRFYDREAFREDIEPLVMSARPSSTREFMDDFSFSADYIQEQYPGLRSSDAYREVAAAVNKLPTPATHPEEFYDKSEQYITMRDGVRLYAVIYTPKDAGPDNTYPIMMSRTCYSAGPYGPDEFSGRFARMPDMAEEQYIFVFQDVRGRWMSEGTFDNMRPYIPNKTDDSQVDESSDTYDSIDWLVKNLPHNNGNVGIWGISYPGFYSTCSLIDAHPALKAVSPQAPIGDFYFDDFHHNGAYTLAYWFVNNLFGIQKTEPTSESWYQFPSMGTPDPYDFYLKHTPLTKLDAVSDPDNFFWDQIQEHPDYDEFWQKRNIVQHLKDVRPAVMTVGGWYDAEDLYGPLMTYGNIEKWNPDTYNTLVMGPWSHGDWSRRNGSQAVSNVFFGNNINESYQANIEAAFFYHWLKGPADGETGLPEAYVFDGGKKQWNTFSNWPPVAREATTFKLATDGSLTTDAPAEEATYSEFVSDPAHPVPFRTDIKPMFIPRKYMADDQRHNARRPDVLTYVTDPLEDDLTLAGPITADLFVSTTGTDADWIVKVIDVYPGDTPNDDFTQDNMSMGGYQQLIRGEAFRGRYRNGFETGEPFVPNEVTPVSWKLQDIFHTFKKGHRLMVQVQSSWFPYVDMNPQTFVPNIFKATESDFQAHTHRVWQGAEYPSSITVGRLE